MVMATEKLNRVTTKGTGTNASNVGGTLSYERIGNIVVVSGTLTTSASFNAGVTMVSNLPKPVVNNCYILEQNNNSASGLGYMQLTVSNGDGVMQSGQSIPSGASLRICGAYLCQ